VLRQLELPDELPEEQLGAALAYLEVVWLEATRLATETEAAFAELEDHPAAGEALPSKARRYHGAVCFLREAIAKHVNRLLSYPEAAEVDRVGSAALGPHIRPAIPLDLL
jgi:hypothetical protein